MTSDNPYNSTKPGNLFVGYERLRGQLLNGFRNGNSFAILGGRRCGKTSLLLQVEQDVQTTNLGPFKPLPRFLDIQGLDRLTPALLFETIYHLVIQETEATPWVAGESGRAYQDFLAHLDNAKPLLDQRYGPDWLIILLIDELDAAISKLSNDQFFQNLRNLSMISRFHRHFRLMASGVREMSHLISSGASPLNHLRNRHLGVLTGAQARQLIAFGFPAGLDSEVESFLFQLTGRHPYVLQGVLEHFWGEQGESARQSVRRAAREFLDQQRTFTRWMNVFGQAEHAVYQLLSEAPEGTRHVRDIRHCLDPALAPHIDEALTVLSYHGLIDDSEPDEPQIAGTLFRDWYRDHRPAQSHSAESQLVPLRLVNVHVVAAGTSCQAVARSPTMPAYEQRAPSYHQRCGSAYPRRHRPTFARSKPGWRHWRRWSSSCGSSCNRTRTPRRAPRRAIRLKLWRNGRGAHPLGAGPVGNQDTRGRHGPWCRSKK